MFSLQKFVWLVFVLSSSSLWALEKFVCYSAESTSCLGGGSGTHYAAVLRDRAISKADAYARCGGYKMLWGTHSIPKDKECPDSDGGSSSSGSSASTSSPPSLMRACNRTNRNLNVAGAEYNGVNNRAFAWWQLAPGECKDIHSVRAQGYLMALEDVYTGPYYKPNINPGYTHQICVDAFNKYTGGTAINAPERCGQFGVNVIAFPMGIVIKNSAPGGITWDIRESDQVAAPIFGGTIVHLKSLSTQTRTISLAEETVIDGERLYAHQPFQPAVGPNQVAEWRIQRELKKSNGLTKIGFHFRMPNGERLIYGFDENGIVGVPCKESLRLDPMGGKYYKVCSFEIG